ncbi:hypothetical protein BU251_04560 [Candidatus Velamenicoccus archaeovorus]|uniref:Uncharacterized protein n=1 Tax=Velamenicoccus archaeovorus TaxID=1930593 RepID=A0A410P4D4_VELA1|nr:hypothetical protein BU251_04560 [Candidatus Velamenicoccus archaeovorus]
MWQVRALPGALFFFCKARTLRGAGRPSPRFRGDSDPDDMSGERQRGKAPMESEAEAERKF